jgi:hypothetical protein
MLRPKVDVRSISGLAQDGFMQDRKDYASHSLHKRSGSVANEAILRQFRYRQSSPWTGDETIWIDRHNSSATRQILAVHLAEFGFSIERGEFGIARTFSATRMLSVPQWTPRTQPTCMVFHIYPHPSFGPDIDLQSAIAPEIASPIKTLVAAPHEPSGAIVKTV